MSHDEQQIALPAVPLSHGACAGLAARMSTQMRREREEQRRLQEEEADFERVMSLNLGPMNSLDGEQEVWPAHYSEMQHLDEALDDSSCYVLPYSNSCHDLACFLVGRFCRG